MLLIAGILLSQPRWLFSLATNFFPGALYAVDTADNKPDTKQIALTIDDGPSPATTEILAVLAEHNVKATFFNIGDNLAGNEAAIQQTVAAGHELGNHLTTDYPSIRLSNKDFEANLLTAEQALRSFLKTEQPASELKWLRPGMGFYSSAMVKTAQKHDYRVVLGSRFPYDTHIHSSRFASAFILHTVQPGDIIVLHDGEAENGKEGRGDRTIKTLQTILPALQKEGYTITTLSDLTK
ncbi:MAG: chitin deacetylase family protein [Cyanobacteria bacterium P01_D01_bin.36]